MQPTGEDIKDAAEGAKTLFAAIQKYIYGVVIAGLIVVVGFQFFYSSSKYEKGYNTAKKEAENEMESMGRTIKFQDRQIEVIQSKYNALFIKSIEDSNIVYKELIIKKEQR